MAKKIEMLINECSEYTAMNRHARHCRKKQQWGEERRGGGGGGFRHFLWTFSSRHFPARHYFKL